MTPLFPDYSVARALLTFLDETPKDQYLNMLKAIYELTGTPQETVDWKNPSEWIPKRLKGNNREMAFNLWTETNNLVNPRHVRGCNFLFKRHSLLDETGNIYGVTSKGRNFLESNLGRVESEVDEEEGVFKLLKIIYLKKNGKSVDFYQDWHDYLLANTNYSKQNAIYSLLRYRLSNLISRSLIQRKANKYSLSKEGIRYLESYGSISGLQEELKGKEKEDQLTQAVQEFKNEQRALLKAKLHAMNPFAFEELIGTLLEAMGYEDVEVTQASRDKGVDVVGTIQNGISAVKEVIQVKRFKGNVGRGVVSQLRGDVPIFKAYRGTIITTSDFTKDAKETALNTLGVPVTLINGEKLIDLMIKHQIGIIPKPLSYFLVNEDLFNSDIEPT